MEKVTQILALPVSLGALYGPLILRTLPAPVHCTVINVFEVTVHLISYGPGQKLGFKLQSV